MYDMGGIESTVSPLYIRQEKIRVNYRCGQKRPIERKVTTFPCKLEPSVYPLTISSQVSGQQVHIFIVQFQTSSRCEKYMLIQSREF